MLLSGADGEEVEEVKSKPAKAAAKPAKRPVLPDSVKAIAKVILLIGTWTALIAQRYWHAKAANLQLASCLVFVGCISAGLHENSSPCSSCQA